MSWTPPPRAAWVEPLNALAAGERGRSLAPVDAEAALAAAVSATGLDDFGDEGFSDGLLRLCRAIEEEARPTLLGRLLARAEIARTLESRLRGEALFRAHPEILREEIVEPLFVTGLARTGTSLLHELLWSLPGSRAPLAWEMADPAAAVAGAEPARAAAAIERIAAEMALQDQALPAIRTMHELGAELPNECIYLFAHEFASDMFTGFFSVPSYTLWMARRDHAPLYVRHRRLLQLLQWRRPPRRWVLKAPSHLSHLRELFAAYPDARVVITHRDPLQVLGSLANLMASLRWTRSDRVDHRGIVAAMAFGHAYLAGQVMAEREAGKLPADRILDVRYGDLVSDPVAAARAIAIWQGAPLGADAEAALGAWVASRPKDRHGAHEYAFADTGLDLATERARHAAYLRRYGVASEV